MVGCCLLPPPTAVAHDGEGGVGAQHAVRGTECVRLHSHQT